ncbi:MAG: hypothetical protein R6V18_05125 [Desulfuromonadaceae bacterium]
MLQGVEKPGARAFNFNGFLMADYQNSGGGNLEAGPFKGQPMAKGLVGPSLNSSKEFNIRKFQGGVRGALSDDWGYSVRGVTGNNIATRGKHDNSVMLVEASLTWSTPVGPHVRAGMFKTPGSEESLAFAPPGNYVNLTNVTNMLVQERFFPADGSSVTHDNNYDTCSCCRDSGIMLFDAVSYQQWEFSYAAMLGRGYGLGYSDTNSNPDLYLYMAAERLFNSGKGMWRHGWKFFGWSQHGERTLRAGVAQHKIEATRERYGFGTTLLWQRWRLNAELVSASGMIFMASDGGAVPGSVSNDGAMVASYNVFPDDRAYGWYVDGGYELLPGVWGCVRYDEVRFGTETHAERELISVTLGVQYYVTRTLQLKLNYEFRSGAARRQEEASVTNQNMDEMPDRFGAQVVWRF